MRNLYQHDCSRCSFLGQHEGHDLYFCEQGGLLPTVIARYGSDGPDYTSGLGWFNIPALVEAERRAKALGFIEAQQ